ncbi:MAG: hypothetical protein RIT04_630 [Candidatus Parcubacteria bacterium]|jgi:TatD DNase family protein
MSVADLKYIDIHCHLNYPQYASDLDETVTRAVEAGIGMIVIGTDLATSKRAIEIAEKHEYVWAIIGLHPIHAHEERFDYDAYMTLAKHPKVVGIGECGYDYFRTDASVGASWGASQYEAQHEAFTRQIDLAHAVGKPLMLHLRSAPGIVGAVGVATNPVTHVDAYADALAVLRAYPGGLKVRGDAHFFAGTLAQAKAFIELDFTISFTGVITFARSYDEIIREIPLDRILSETDAPFVAPMPYRGERNEPAYVIEVAHKLAELKGALALNERDAVLKQLVDNARKLFSI